MAKNIEKINKIQFLPFFRTNDEDLVEPVPAMKSLPDWYMSAKKKDPNDPKMPTFKKCMSFMDAMGLGYYFLTPCDITISVKDTNVNITIPENFADLIKTRQKMNEFHTPEGYYDEHLAITPQWGLQLPRGYSALYTGPLNNFQLPFVVTSGIIENDKLFSPGQVPIFIKKGFEGIIKQGTPFLQVIPFKREDWESGFADYPIEEAMNHSLADGMKFRSVDDGYYRDHIWEKKVFK